MSRTRNGNVTLELRVGKVYIRLSRRDCQRLLPALSALGEDCSETCKRMRTDLGKALTETDSAPASKNLKALYHLFTDREFAPAITSTRK